MHVGSRIRVARMNDPSEGIERQASTRTTGQIGFGMTSASQHLVALIWAVLLGLAFLGSIGWWWVNARRRRRRTPDLGILTALHQEREPERSGREA